jgi:hypothetical protein
VISSHDLCVCNLVANIWLSLIVRVPSMETGCCLGSEGNSVSMGGVSEGGPGLPERGKDKQSMPSEGRDNMEKEEEEQSNRR